MASQAQILANRRNTQESDSPRTAPMEKTTKSLTFFMQNKANFRNAKMNENLFATKVYENEIAFRLQKYKPNQSQF